MALELRALSVGEVGPALGCPPGADGAPALGDVANLIRRVVTAVGVAVVDSLIPTVAELAAPQAGAAGQTSRVRAAVRCLVDAGDLRSAIVSEQELCWVAPPRRVRLTYEAAALLGPITSGPDGLASGEAPIRRVSLTGAEESLEQYLGPPDYRATLRDMQLEGWAGATPEDLAAFWAERSGEPRFAREAEGGGPFEAWLNAPELGLDVVTPDFLALPVQLRRALALGGAPSSDRLDRWRLDPDFLGSLQSWLGRPAEPAGEEWAELDDPSQAAVVGAPAGARLIVEAGPGSGKTRVACERIARLTESGASPTRMWLLSFTQAAVAELRGRAGSFMADPSLAGDLRITTLDALAGGLRQGFGGEEDAPGSFDDAIASALALVRSEDRGLKGFLGALEHLVVDEAQDLTGNRRALVLELIGKLPSSCGVTLFEDPAQAIYGFSEAHAPAKSLASELLENPSSGFGRARLDRDHRTRADALRALNGRMRALILAAPRTENLYTRVRGEIEATAAPAGLLAAGRSGSQSTLILFRSRLELLSAAGRLLREGAILRVSTSGRTPAAEPWIGALLRPCEAVSLTRSAFDGLWAELWPVPASISADEAWRRLRSAAGGPRDSLDLLRLAKRIGSSSPPLALSRRHVGRSGPLLSTIHGAKGREAEHVVLVLSQQTGAGPNSDEEARVLFVAATRARTSLAVAGTRAVSGQPASGRLWTRWRDGHARIEVGLDSDVDHTLRRAGSDEAAEADEARQRRLWAAADQIIPVRAQMRGDRYELFGDGGQLDGASAGLLTPGFTRDLRRIGTERHGGSRPGRTLSGLFVAGCRTVCETPDAEGRSEAPRFGLAPVVLGLANVFFNPVSGSEALHDS